MKRLLLASVAVTALAAAFAALSAAAPWAGSSQAGPASADAVTRLPALPPEVRERRRWQIGVKCDFPPFGYINRENRIAGYDVDVARRFAELAFGRRNRVSLTCVTTPSRIPVLQQRRVDIIIATLTWTAAREEVIDYSYPYYNATGRLLVPNTSSLATARLSALNGRRVATTRGSIYDRWTRTCFPRASLVLTDSPVAALENLRSGRADTFMFDDTFLLGVAANDRNLRMTNHLFLNIPYGIGIRKGDVAMKRWVDAALLQMKRRDEFWRILQRNSPRAFWRFFRTRVPRPGTRERYPRGTASNPAPAEACPGS
ncbi:MAG: transporter substrate-binding domain-containing protein [Actinomycetota bacterium]|nr:transporter substrate-binding domain-containing protein [Actinomycetota bacterium]